MDSIKRARRSVDQEQYQITQDGNLQDPHGRLEITPTLVMNPSTKSIPLTLAGFKVLFLTSLPLPGVIGAGYRSDISLDDVSFTDCNIAPLCPEGEVACANGKQCIAKGLVSKHLYQLWGESYVLTMLYIYVMLYS